ncbi:MAG: tetratricopeptide repeat protein, partial [Myxococcota bacterium]
FVLAGSLLALRALPRRPYAAVGWFWFLGTLVPVIGLVQVGQAAMADRYTYLPLIGLALAAVWWVRDLVGARPRARLAAAALGVAVLSAFAVASAVQVRTWRNSVTLFEHALRVTRDNHVAHINLAMAYAKSRRLEDAEHQLAEARRIAPGSVIAEGALGEVRLKQGRPVEALRHLELASQRAPRASRWHAGRAQALLDLAEFEAAAEGYGAALRIDPHNATLHGNLGLALFRAGRVDDAVASYEESLRLVPGRADVRGNLGVALAARGDEERAISQFERALAARPELALLRAHLARALAGRGEYAGAVAQLAEAVRLEPEQADLYVELARALTKESADASGRRDPAALDRLAATYAAAGRFDEAARSASSAASLADQRGDTALAAEIRARLAAYEERRSGR